MTCKMHPLLKSLADNPELFEAMKIKVLQKFQIPDIDDTTSNELIGETVRAIITGRKMVEEVFREIATLKTQRVEETFNQAR